MLAGQMTGRNTAVSDPWESFRPGILESYGRFLQEVLTNGATSKEGVAGSLGTDEIRASDTVNVQIPLLKHWDWLALKNAERCISGYRSPRDAGRGTAVRATSKTNR